MSGFVFVVNPRSANGATVRRFERMRPRIVAALGDVDVKLTEAPMHAAELARAAVRAGAKAVVAVGGDGTNHEVVNGFFDEQGELIESGTAFGVIVSGTGGDFRRTLSWSKDADEAIARLARFETKMVDVGRIRCRDAQGKGIVRMFLNSGSAGLVGHVVNAVNGTTKAFGPQASFLVGSLRGILQYTPQRVRIALDDAAPADESITLLVAANGQYFGGGMWIAPDALPFDGLFHVVVIREASRAYLARQVPKLYTGGHVDLPITQVRTARRVVVEPVDAQDVLVEADGEQPGRLPATFELVPAAVPLIV